ncbi:unnamed protein product, partial [Clonostachys chloroleuca]
DHRGELERAVFRKLLEDKEFSVAEVVYAQPNRSSILRRAEIRCVCMWMIYAPNKVRKNALLPYRYDAERGFELGYWEKWRALLQKYLDIFLDEDTQNLIYTALSSMEIAEQVTL